MVAPAKGIATAHARFPRSDTRPRLGGMLQGSPADGR